MIRVARTERQNPARGLRERASKGNVYLKIERSLLPPLSPVIQRRESYKPGESTGQRLTHPSQATGRLTSQEHRREIRSPQWERRLAACSSGLRPSRSIVWKVALRCVLPPPPISRRYNSKACPPGSACPPYFTPLLESSLEGWPSFITVSAAERDAEDGKNVTENRPPAPPPCR